MWNVDAGACLYVGVSERYLAALLHYSQEATYLRVMQNVDVLCMCVLWLGTKILYHK